MILNNEEIKNLNKNIEPFDESKLGNASYDLSVEKIITMDGTERDSYYRVKSQEMVWVICREKLKMPKNIIGFAHVKTKLTREGILSMNTGIIDPTYEGKISTLLINFGKSEKTIEKNDIVLRVAFAKINEYNNIIPYPAVKNEEAYLAEIRKSANNFDETFLNLGTMYKKIWKIIAILGAIATIVGLVVLMVHLARYIYALISNLT